MSASLKDRVSSYIELANNKLLSRLPIIVCLNGRAFSKATQLLNKPFDNAFAQCAISTMLRVCAEIDGAVFGYQHNDEIVIIVRNDQHEEITPWCDNKIQKICSITSSIATLHFNDCATSTELNLGTNDPIFISQVFAVPDVSEAINTIVYKQQNNFHTSIQFACSYELLKMGYDKSDIKEMLIGLSIDEKINILQQECQINFADYPLLFRRGAAAYKVPKILPDGNVKNKWFVNLDLPLFAKDKNMLSNALKEK